MNTLELYLKAEAATTGRARPRRLLRHVHVEQRPIAIAVMQMANEAHGLWGALVGDDPDRPKLIVAPEPRNPLIQFQAMAELASILVPAVAAAGDGRGAPDRRGFTRCLSAPQLLVANKAVVDLLTRLSRRMRTAGYSGRYDVPPELNLAGAYLAFYGEAALCAGSSLTFVSTAELTRHWSTGQSSLEDAHLGSVLAWIDPTTAEEIDPSITNGLDLTAIHAARVAELVEQLPMSTLTNPETDNKYLVDMVSRFNAGRRGATDAPTVDRLGGEVRDKIRDALLPTWRGLWIAHRIVSAIPPAPGVARRWEKDLSMFTRHVDYMGSGGHMAFRDSARRAAMTLADREGAVATVERDEALEDPLGLAAALCDGKAISGRVVSVDTTNREPGPSGRTMVSRPLVTLELDADCPFPDGTELWWTERAGDLGVVVEGTVPSDAGGATVVLKVTSGMRGSLPGPRSTSVFTVYGKGRMGLYWVPATTPWTHTPDPGAPRRDTLDIDDAQPLDEALTTEGVA